jgi:hypothetical protein
VIKDDCNNAATAVDITYSGGDTEAPHLVGVIPAGQTGLNVCFSNIPAGPSESDIAALYADNCGTVHVTKTGLPTGNNCNWSVTYHYVIKDDCNNAATAIDITFSGGDTEDPVITNCKTSTTRLLDFGETNYTIQGTEFDVSARDNCSLSSLVYSLNGATSGSGTTLAGIDLNGGTTTITWTATDGCGHTKMCQFTVTVNKRPTILVYTGDGVEQYSDQQLLTATLTDQTNGQPISGKTVTFKIGTQSASATTNASGVASTTLILNQDPATVCKVATSFAEDATYLASSDLDNFDITQEDACPNYNGDFFVNSNLTTGAFTVKLQLALSDDADGFKGDVSKATVTFKVMDGTTIVGTYAATMVAGSLSPDKTLAWFSAQFTSSLGTNCLSKTYDISWTINNYYQDGASSSTGHCPGSDLGAEVTVSAPTSDFITGGGYVVLDNTATGKDAGDIGSKNNFGFNVKWNKSLSNIQGGGINSTVRKGTHQYQIKGTKVTALSVTPANGSTPATAAFTCNAVVNDIVNNVAVSSEGNCTAIVEITDVCEPGSGSPTSSDQIAITVKDKNGVVIYSNHWNTASKKTDKVVLNGGNLQIHSGSTTDAPKCGVTTSTRADMTARQAESTIVMNKFNLKAFPNPSEDQFTLKIESDNTKDRISVRVTDMFGRTIRTYTNLFAGQTLRIGSNYKTGVYFIEMMQGNIRKQLKLIKQ